MSTRTYPRPPHFLFALAGTIAALLGSSRIASADNGVWTDTTGSGLWSDTSKWNAGIVADGSGFTADFSTLDLLATETVHLDSARTITGLAFGDANPSHDWILDNNGTSTNTLTLAGSPTISVTNQTATISANLLGTAGFTKTGNGILVLSGANAYTGSTLVTTGTLVFSGTGSQNALQAGGSSGLGVVTINTTGTLAFTGDGSGFNAIGGITGGDGGTGAGAVTQTSGTVTVGASAGYLEMGADTGTGAAARTTYGSYVLAGGTLTTSGSAGNGSGIRVGAGSYGVFTQTGGTLNMNRFLVAGTGSGPGNTGAGIGVITLTGGTTNILTSGGNQRGILLGDNAGSTGILNVGTQAGGSVIINNADTNGIRIGNNAAAGTLGILNLNSGIINLTGNTTTSGLRKSGASATGIVNLNGGTIRAGASNVNLIDTSLSSVNVYRGGVVIDTQANSDTIPAALNAVPGNGIYPAGGALAISTGGGSGYIGSPVVTVSGGSGTSALAIANISNGVVTSVTLTNPGQNYVVGDTLNFAFNGGGTSSPAPTFQYTLTNADLASNSTGGLTKIGSGTLTLSGSNTYTGATTVSQGTLIVSGGISGSLVSIESGSTLGGTGSIGGVTVKSGGLLAPGTGVGTLNTGNVSFSGNSTLKLDMSSSTTDTVLASGTVSLAATIVLDITLAAQPNPNATFTIVNSTGGILGYAGGGRLSYQGNSLDEGEHFIVTSGALSQEFVVSYTADGGTDITLLAVPEPATAGAILSGCSLMAGLIRPRRKARG